MFDADSLKSDISRTCVHTCGLPATTSYILMFAHVKTRKTRPCIYHHRRENFTRNINIKNIFDNMVNLNYNFFTLKKKILIYNN